MNAVYLCDLCKRALTSVDSEGGSLREWACALHGRRAFFWRGPELDLDALRAGHVDDGSFRIFTEADL